MSEYISGVRTLPYLFCSAAYADCSNKIFVTNYYSVFSAFLWTLKVKNAGKSPFNELLKLLSVTSVIVGGRFGIYDLQRSIITLNKTNRSNRCDSTKIL